MSKTRPIDLIVANTMHDAVEMSGGLDALIDAIKKAGAPFEISNQKNLANQLAAEVARKLLCDVAHSAAIGKVYAALKAVGAPCSNDDIKEGMRAAQERGQ